MLRHVFGLSCMILGCIYLYQVNPTIMSGVLFITSGWALCYRPWDIKPKPHIEETRNCHDCGDRECPNTGKFNTVRLDTNCFKSKE